MMTDKELRRLHREDLLQILIAQQKQIEDLTAALADAEKAANDRKIAIEESGSLAEAALKLNDIFGAAQQAVDLYTSETRARIDALREEADSAASKARQEAGDIVHQARREADQILDDARREADRIKIAAAGGYIPPQPDPEPVPQPEAQPQEKRKTGLFRRK